MGVYLKAYTVVIARTRCNVITWRVPEMLSMIERNPYLVVILQLLVESVKYKLKYRMRKQIDTFLVKYSALDFAYT